MNLNFKKYAKFYDILYNRKDYFQEAKYIDSIINKFSSQNNKILDIGCGTGSHDFYLANLNYEILGLDTSEEMIHIAKSKIKNQNLKIEFLHHKNFATYGEFDIVISLFHVMSYQTNKEMLENFLKLVFLNLKKGGLFIFDYWYAPAVNFLKVEKRSQYFEIDGIKYKKISTPQKISANLYEIEINICSEVDFFVESHILKSYVPSNFDNLENFKSLNNFGWMTYNAPSKLNWSALTILRKI